MRHGGFEDELYYQSGIFYWLNVLDGFKTAICILLIISSIALISDIIIMIFCYAEGWEYKNCKNENGNPTDQDWKSFLITLKISKYIAPLVVVMGMLAIFIPNKETMIEIMIAKLATVENANFTIETLKEAVSYIVEAIGNLK